LTKKLPSNDGTPALEVSLTAVHPTATTTSSALRPLNGLEADLNSTSETVNLNLASAAASIAEIEQATVAATLPPTCELPSYSDAVRAKKLEAASASDLPPSYFPHNTDIRIPVDPAHVIPLKKSISKSILVLFYNKRYFISFFKCHGIVDLSDIQNYDQEIGSECMFLSAFMIAFFFNWVGFFASICLLPNAAGKYGALSGFGLSMAKWVTIVRVSVVIVLISKLFVTFNKENELHNLYCCKVPRMDG
jgi:hypothetical protein